MYGIVPTSTYGVVSDFPLLSSKIHYDLIDVQSLATLVLTYVSNASEATDVHYVCPLPSDASVCSFKAVIDGTHTIKGVVKEKAKAKAEYDAAVAQGKTAALLRQDSAEIFQVSLGNIRPKQVIDIYISYASLITGNGELDSLRLTFPSVIAPRYGSPPLQLLSLVLSIHPVRTALEFSVSIQMTSQIKSITSPSHPISMTLGASKIDSRDGFDPFKAHVALASSNHLDKDIVVVITCEGLDKPRCTVESFSPEEGAQEFTDAYSLTLVPRFELAPLQKQEYIFLVDRSGSMGGQKMTAVRSALQIMLRSLPSTNTSFNIFSFGTGHSSLWRSSVAYGTESLKTAASHVDGMSADYGGTEIRSALDTVFRTHAGVQDTPLTVFILTDGEAYDLDGVQSIVSQYVDQYKDKANFLRVFCMGIGNSVSKAMCDLIARAGQGAVVYVGEDEKPDKKLITLLRAARGPIITNVSVDWGVAVTSEGKDDDFEMILPQPEAPMSLFDEKAIPKDDISLGPQAIIPPPPPMIQQAPTNASLLTLYPGFRTSLFAIIRRDKGGNSAPAKSVRVKGVVQGRAVELEVPVIPAIAPKAFSEKDRIKVLHVLAARALVQRFEDEGKKTGIMSDRLKAEVLRVAERYGITSSETSFVAVDEEGTPVLAVALSEEKAKRTVGGFAAGRSLAPSSAPLASAPAKSSGLFFKQRLRSMAALRPRPASFSSAPAPSASTATLVNSAAMLTGFETQSSGVTALGMPLPPVASPQVLSAPIARSSRSRRKAGSTRVDMQIESFSPHDLRSAPEDGVKNSQKSEDLQPTIESIARYQTFEGSFDGSPALYKLLAKQDFLPSLPDALKPLGDVGAKVWCSILCLVFLQKKFPEDKSVWELMVEKGDGWVSDTLTERFGDGSVSVLFDTLKKEAGSCIV